MVRIRYISTCGERAGAWRSGQCALCQRRAALLGAGEQDWYACHYDATFATSAGRSLSCSLPMPLWFSTYVIIARGASSVATAGALTPVSPAVFAHISGIFLLVVEDGGSTAVLYIACSLLVLSVNSCATTSRILLALRVRLLPANGCVLILQRHGAYLMPYAAARLPSVARFLCLRVPALVSAGLWRRRIPLDAIRALILP